MKKRVREKNCSGNEKKWTKALWNLKTSKKACK